jgi:choline dehydrogenase-like flavoprotein
MSTDADVCVVGAGAGGAVAAWALVRKGARVLLLETGPRIAPSEFATHSPDWEITSSPMERITQDRSRRSYMGFPGESLDAEFEHLMSDSPTMFAERPPRRRRHFHYARAIGVGGSTLHYQGEAHRFPAHAFRMRSQHGVAADWPITYEELAPYYARIEELLGVAGDPRNPFKPEREAYPYRAHPLSAASQRVAAGAQRLGWQSLANPVAILPQPRRDRAACHYCNGCERGCAVAAKGSVDVAVIPEAERTGRLRVVTGFQASALEHGNDGRIQAVIGHDETGLEQRYRARSFVLAAGAIETPRILLNSRGGVHPEGVGNAHGQVGTGLMEHLFVFRRYMFSESLQTDLGIPIDSRVWDFNGATGESQTGPAGFVLGQSCGGFQGPVAYALEGARGFGPEHRAAMRRHFGAGIELFGVAEQLPRSENRVGIAEENDRFGIPLARVDTRLDPGDLEVMSQTWARLGELADATGLTNSIGQFTAYDTPNAAHVGGTCRMGDDPRSSVVSAFCGVHGVSNLMIADASVLVTQGAGDSPSLTIQALALRSAEMLFERAQAGEL